MDDPRFLSYELQSSYRALIGRGIGIDLKSLLISRNITHSYLYGTRVSGFDVETRILVCFCITVLYFSVATELSGTHVDEVESPSKTRSES